MAKNNISQHPSLHKVGNGVGSERGDLQTSDSRPPPPDYDESTKNASSHSNKIENGQVHKTELNLAHPDNQSDRIMYKSEVSIKMDEDPKHKTDDILNSNSLSPSPSSSTRKEPLSRTATKSRSSESDQIGLDCEDSSDRCSSDEDRSDLSSDYYGMDKSSPSPSPSTEFHEMRERNSDLENPVILQKSGGGGDSFFKSHNGGHDNLGYIEEESETEEGGRASTIAVSRSTSGSVISEERLNQSGVRSLSTTSFAEGVWNEEIFLDNIKRVILRDFRKEIARSLDRHDHDRFSWDIFFIVFRQQVSFSEKF